MSRVMLCRIRPWFIRLTRFTRLSPVRSTHRHVLNSHFNNNPLLYFLLEDLPCLIFKSFCLRLFMLTLIFTSSLLFIWVFLLQKTSYRLLSFYGFYFKVKKLCKILSTILLWICLGVHLLDTHILQFFVITHYWMKIIEEHSFINNIIHILS